MKKRFSAAAIGLMSCALLWGNESPTDSGSADTPKPVPATRAEVKAALNRLRHRKPRLPMPPPTPEEEQAARERAAAGGAAGGLGGGIVNNARMRALHLPKELQTNTGIRPQGNPRERDPNQVFDYGFSTELFWIVSRVNNCHYCLGHQEHKLLAAGLDDDRIAALDGDWEQFTPAEQAAFAFTRKLTIEPQKVTDEDVARLKSHYNDLQVYEIIALVSRYNSTNRWTDSLGIPQEDHRDFETPTNAKFRDFTSLVAPIAERKVKEQPQQKSAAPAVMEPRAELESRQFVESTWVKQRQATARLPIPEEAAARELLGDTAPEGKLPHWVRLMLSNPKTGPGAVANYQTVRSKGKISPRLRAEIAWVAARSDRAWYALHVALQDLRSLGMTDSDIFALDHPTDALSAAEKQVLAFTRKLTETPQWMVDSDIEKLRKHFSDTEVAEIVYRVTMAAYFDRLTEAAGLPLEQ